ncbi:Rne/Rng family ribonuclease [Chondrinema litorale]|uniref:Rne/Rng family ribonuclease n=1 Tax=Chondrinema litorale TaxID=2994555 RepID=UPI002542D168|nr:Rne/Rng family ribonuclease [Chondrinema litorale]UZR95565.1 Rne/Rng family ribonuclease [Chondrinema litorale]
MSNELVINSSQNGSGGRIALLKDKNLVELHYDNEENKFSVGDIYLGTVRKIVPGLNAAFIDIGYEKDAFLHYLDLGPNIRSLVKFSKLVQSKKDISYKLNDFRMEPQIDKLGKITEVFKQNQKILVQVVKEPISTKGPRLSCELSIAGRYLVLVPFSSSINVSKKITDQGERKRLLRLISSIKPENFGVIIRTVAEGKEVAELDRDLRDLVSKWTNGMKSLVTAKPRQKVIGEMSRAASMLRDMLNESFDTITVDDTSTYEDIKSFIRTIAPEKEKIVKQYNGKTKIFESFGIEKQLKSLFGQTVSLPSGGYLVIEHTEALHVIDVNSGNKSNSETDQETTAFNVNLEAASEIARQLRLRDMGGIIVVDFIDMKKAEHRKNVYEHIKNEMKSDRSKYTVLPLTKFGLMQITRQRVRPELNIVTKETCPTCMGSGSISASIMVSDQLEKELDYILNKQNEKSITIILHPYLQAYFTHGIMSIRFRWFLKYNQWIKFVKDSSLGLNQYFFLNKRKERIEL